MIDNPPAFLPLAGNLVSEAIQIAEDAWTAIRPTGGLFWCELSGDMQTLAIVAARNTLLAERAKVQP